MDVISQIQPFLAVRYRIEREIGAGGMSTVYLAEDTRHHRPVALKVLKPELAAVLGTERFLAEINVTANLQHPHLLPLFDSGEANGLLYYVMPFVEGETLRARLQREKQLPIDDVVRIGTAIAGALHYAHRQGVIHRDLKPENILLHEGEPLVSDFGIALAVSVAGGARMTQSGLSVGTPYYMSPEQATGAASLDPRSDVYSLAAIMYEMLVGEPPHTGSTVHAIIAKVLAEKPLSTRVLRDTVPADLDAVLMRALAKLSADRYKSADEFAAQLKIVQANAGRASNQERQRRFARYAVIGIVVLALTGLIGALVWTAANATATSTTWEVALPSRIEDALDVTSIGNRFGTSLALTNDNRYLAIAAGKKLFLKELDELELFTLADGEFSDIAFSPDGQWLALSSTAIVKTSLDGKVTIPLAQGEFHGIAWLDNKRILADKDGAVWLVSASGDGVTLVARPDSQRRHLGYTRPSALPDGKAAFVTIHKQGQKNTELGLLNIPDGIVKELGVDGSDGRYLRGGYILFNRDTLGLSAAEFSLRRGRITGSPISLPFAVDSRLGGVMRLAVSETGTVVYRSPIDRNTQRVVAAGLDGSVKTIINEPRLYLWPRLSPDARRLALTIVSGQRRDIWIYDMPNGPLLRLTTEGMVNDRPEWTPDGKSIIYRSNRGQFDELWTRPADGTGKPRPFLQFAAAHAAEGVLSADGRYLIIQYDDGRGGVTWFRQMHGDTIWRSAQSKSGDASEGYGIDARLSPDGKWLAYASDQSGTYQVYVKPFPSQNDRYQVSLDGGLSPVWSRDGRRLFYTVRDTVVAADIELDNPFRITGRRRLPEELTIEAPHANYDVSPDGESVIGFRSAKSGSRHVVIERFDLQVAESIRKAKGK